MGSPLELVFVLGGGAGLVLGREPPRVCLGRVLGCPSHLPSSYYRAQVWELVVESKPRYEAGEISAADFTKLIARILPLVNPKVSRIDIYRYIYI